jgi:hypothetical protein
MYVTEDGHKFRTVEEAKKHEELLERVKEFNEKYKVKEIDPDDYGINSSNCISSVALYIEELNEETIQDLTSKYPYLKESERLLERIKTGWNIIIEEEYDSNCIGRWSGYELNIYHPEDIIEERKEQIEKLNKLVENTKNLTKGE